MDLILWRHAEAEAAQPSQADATRALTAKGRKQAAKMGAWLDRHLPDKCRILVSPALRTMQTAEALDRRFKAHAALAVGSTAEQLLAAARWPESREPVLIVGHQPLLGHAASLIIGGARQNWTIRKAAVCWIAQKADGEISSSYIRALIGPDMAGK